MLRFFLETTADRVGIEGTFLTGIRNKKGWTFEDQESLENILHEMLRVVIDKGIEWFEISATPIPKPSIEIGHFIMENYSSLARTFSEKYSIDMSDPMSLYFIEEFFQNAKMRKGIMDWGFISEASSFFGEAIRIKFGGTWRWDLQFSEPSVVIHTEKLEMREYPLYHVVKNCINPYRTIYGHYKYIENVVKGTVNYFHRK